MLGVNISINGNVIYARTAVRMDDSFINKQGESCYLTDTGESLWHKQEDGAVVLAMKLLETIKEQGVNHGKKDRP